MALVPSWGLPEAVGYPWIGSQPQCHDAARLQTIIASNHSSKREKSMQRLKGKTALVVGAGSIGPGWGNGKATAVTFAREGAQVFCVDRNAAAASETAGIISGEGGN